MHADIVLRNGEKEIVAAGAAIRRLKRSLASNSIRGLGAVERQKESRFRWNRTEISIPAV